jgi:hypothetical protein
MPHPANWKAKHGKQTPQAANGCYRCHQPSQCQSCHGEKKPSSHSRKDWDKTHGHSARASSQRCQVCHPQALCDGCHGIKMPHADNWMKTHKKSASFKEDAVCFRCHQKEYCSGCHGKRSS